MKKLIFVLLMCMMMTVAFAGCGSSASEEQAADETVAADTEAAMSGGWEVYADAEAVELPESVQDAFDKGTEQLDGNDLTPMAYFSKQIVAGTNYQILCKSVPVTENPVAKLQVVVIYQDLDGNAEITNIADFDIAKYTDNDGADLRSEEVTGGWEVPEDYTKAPLPENVQAAFDKGIEQVGGSTFTPMAYLGSQVVSGTNYAVLMESELASEDPVKNIQVAIVYEDLEGNVELTNICTIDPAEFNEGQVEDAEE